MIAHSENEATSHISMKANSENEATIKTYMCLICHAPFRLGKGGSASALIAANFLEERKLERVYTDATTMLHADNIQSNTEI